MIEHQLDQLRLSQIAAEIEHEQQQRAAAAAMAAAAAQHLHRQQQQQQIATTLAATSLPPFMASMSQQLHHPNHQTMMQIGQQVNEDHIDDKQTSGATTSGLSHQQAAVAHQQYLRDHQALESRLLNEFIAKMMLNRDEQQHQDRPPAPPAPPPMRHGAEMLTQSLDSATPTHRCDACDISFWTRDLLNYHLMTQCSARSQPSPTRPLAFKFSGPNNFASPPQQLQVPQPSLQNPTDERALIDNLLLAPPGHNHTAPIHRHSFHKPSKSASPTGRRPFGEASTTNNANSLVGIYTGNQHEPQTLIDETLLSRGLASDGSDNWQARLNELSILKQQLLTVPSSSSSTWAHSRATSQIGLPTAISALAKTAAKGSNMTTTAAAAATTTMTTGHESLPFKKRKISEPNMRY